MYTWKIARKEKILEDGVVKSLFFKIVCTNSVTELTSRTEIMIGIDDIPKAGGTPTKSEIKAFLKNHLNEDINAGTLDENDDPLPVILRKNQLKLQTELPVITREDLNIFSKNEEITI